MFYNWIFIEKKQIGQLKKKTLLQVTVNQFSFFDSLVWLYGLQKST